MLVVVGFALVAKLMAAGKEIAIAWRYGVSEVVDAYLFVFSLVSLPVSIWYSVLTIVFIPLAARLRREIPWELSRFSSELLSVAIGVASVSGLVGWAILTGLFQSSLSGLSDEVRSLALSMTPWLATLIPLGIIGHYGSVLMMSEGRHANTLFEGIPAFALLLAILCASSGGVTPLVLGSIVGVAFQMIAALLNASKSPSFGFPRFSMQSPVWPMFWSGIGVMLIGQVMQSLTVVVDQLFAARLGPGAIATMGYSTRILSLILTLGATAIARASLPIFSAMQAENRQDVYGIAMYWTYIMLALGLLALVLGWPSAHLLVGLLFERGAFTAADTETVAGVLRYALLQVPFYFAALLASQVLFSQHRYYYVAATASLALLVKLTASVSLVPLFGLKGLMIATAVMYAGSFCAFILGLRRLKARSD